MSFDGMAEKAAIEARLSTLLLGVRVHTEIPEESKLETYPETGLVKPYILLSFGSFYPSADDRSMMGEEQQPQVMPVIIECWASDAGSAQKTAGAVRTIMLGWPPDPNNATALEFRGGGWFPGRANASGRPSRSMESVNFVTTLNQSILGGPTWLPDGGLYPSTELFPT